MIRFFASHPTAANLMMIIFFVLGFMVLPDLQRETFPEFESGRVRISVVYPGASAEEMEEAVGQRIEDALDGIDQVKEVRAESREGITMVRVEMQDDGDMQTFIDDIRNAVDSIGSFPEDAEEPVISEMYRTSHVVAIAVSGQMTVQHLKEYCEVLKRKLKRLPDVSLVNVGGFSERQIQVRVHAGMLLQYGLSINDIANTIAAQSFDLPAGTIETREQEILLRFADKSRTIREFENIVVMGGSGGAEVRLGDIAEVVDRFKLDEAKMLINDQRAALLFISKSSKQDSLDVYDAVKRFLEEERRVAPAGVELTLTYDLASIIRDRLQLVFRNGWQGLILVFIAMFVFFNFRLAFWVALGLPVSFLGAFFLMRQVGYTLNMMTTLSLLLSIGILMDDAIVIAENVAVHLRKGKVPLKAVVDGVNEVKNGVIASFLTTACVFIPMAYLEGQMGKVLLVIPVVLLFVLSVSLVEAFLILPHHLAHSLKSRDMNPNARIRGRIEAGLNWIRDRLLGRMVRAAVNRRYFTVGLILMFLLISLSMFMGGRLKFVPFPDIEGDILEARILLPQGTPLQRTEAVVDHLVAALKETDRVLKTEQSDGRSLIENIRVAYSSNADADESGPHLATVSVDLLSNEQREVSLERVRNFWRRKTGTVPDVISLNFGQPQMGPGGQAIVIQFQGEDLDELKQASMELSVWLSRLKGVFDIFDDMRPGKPEIRMKLKPGAVALGLNANMVAGQVRAAFSGRRVNEIQVGYETYEVNVRLHPDDKDSLKDLESFHIAGPGGVRIPLEKVVTFETDRGYARIMRVNGARTLTLQAGVNRSVANTGEIINKFKNEFLPHFEIDHPDVRVTVRGEYERSQRTSGSMARMAVVGILGIFILLSFQFKSYSEPFIVMMAIPFAIIGVIWGHILLGYPMSLPSMLGFISLCGIVVNDSILLVEFVKNRRREGMPAKEAAVTASRERFRAVLLTSITTIAGLIPLLSETSLQAQLLIPIAISIAFGLLTSTGLILVVIPCLYAIAHDFRLTARIEARKTEAD